jgi:hypothetical protein
MQALSMDADLAVLRVIVLPAWRSIWQTWSSNIANEVGSHSLLRTGFFSAAWTAIWPLLMDQTAMQ